jgi:general secretion pathway protein D
VRGTADQVNLAEKLIQDIDKPKAEVVVDIIVMQANRIKAREIFATFGPGINVPITFGKTTPGTDGGEPTTDSSVTLRGIGSIGSGDFSTIVPGGIIKALMSDSQTRVIQQPQVRAVEMMKASLRIGDRIPYASGSFQPGVGVGGGGLNPLVQTQFNFADVGVNVDLTPKVHGRNEISMHIEIEISDANRRVEIGGVSQPIIAQKKIVHDIRLRDGEVNLLGGLMQMEDIRNINGLPWLAEIPVVGRLFGTNVLNQNRGELLIAIIPHIVRSPELTDVNIRGVSAGNDQNVKLNYSPRPQEPVVPPPAAPAPAATEPAKPAAEPAKPAAEPAQPRLIFSPAGATVQMNAPVTVQIVLENVTDLYAAPVNIKFDPKILRLTSIKPGPLLSADGQKINFTESTMNDTGDAIITLNRLPGTGGVAGTGAILNLTFQAIGRGTSPVAVSDAEIKNVQMQSIPVSAPSMTIVVQ